MGTTSARGIFQTAFHITGTTAANANIRWTAPCDCTLLHVSAVASNDSDATLIVGIPTDTDEYVQETAIGDSNVPVEFDGDDFYDADGNQHSCYYPHIADGTVITVTLDYDGATGTAANDPTIVLTFAEG
jgi:hypothetical protein